MTENYQHSKPPTFDDEDTTTPEPTGVEPGTPGDATAPTTPDGTTINVQRGRILGQEPTGYAQPANPANATTPAPAPETTAAGPNAPRIVVVPSKTASPRPMAPETNVPASEGSAVWNQADTSKVAPVTWIILGVICVLALVLRLREPLSNAIMGAEDPYLHMNRTWNLVQGNFPRDYPVGFMILLAPFTLLGPDMFYTIARFAPAFSGPIMCLGMFLFCKNYMLPAGALTASFLLAVMPEVILRTNLLFPTAVDLAVLPFLFLGFFRLIEGQRWAMYSVIGMTLGLLLVHPWFVALMLPPMAAFGLITLVTHKERRTWATSGSIAGLLGIVGLVWLFRQFEPGTLLAGFSAKFFEVLGNPATIVTSPPVHVNLPYMLTVPAMLLAVVGGVYAVIHRSRLGMLALLWTLMLLPLTLVDWFGVWYIPHRTVAYLAVGIALLGGIGVAEIIHKFTKANINLRVPATLGTLALVGLLTIPSAVAVDPWYRLYGEDEFAAWEELDARDADFTMCGSWQIRAGYRAITANEAEFNPDFFRDENLRAVIIGQHPGLYVLIDGYTTNGTEPLPIDFLNDGSQWEPVGEWNQVKAYRHRS